MGIKKFSPIQYFSFGLFLGGVAKASGLLAAFGIEEENTILKKMDNLMRITYEAAQDAQNTRNKNN